MIDNIKWVIFLRDFKYLEGAFSPLNPQQIIENNSSFINDNTFNQQPTDK